MSLDYLSHFGLSGHPFCKDIGDAELTVRLSGFSGALALTTHLVVPLADVVGARVVPIEEARAEGRGLRAPGVHVPGVFRAGSYRTEDSWQFWYVSHADSVLVIDLDHDKYQRLVLEVAEPESLAERINQRRAG